MALERQHSCVARLFRIIAYKQRTNVTCVARVFRLIALRTNDGCTSVAPLFGLITLRTRNATFVADLFCLMA